MCSTPRYGALPSRVVASLLVGVSAMMWICVLILAGGGHGPSLVAADWFRIRGPTTISQAVTVTGNFHLVTISDATFTSSSGVLKILLGDMMNAQGTRPLTIQLCSCTFTNQAAMYVIGRTSPVSTAANSGALTLIMLGLSVTNAGVAFAYEMPFNSIISMGRPKFRLSGTGTTFPQLSGAAQAGLLFYSAAFRGGSFLFFGQPESLTANTFEGTAGLYTSLLFQGSNKVASGCMFHIYQLSSVNANPINSVSGASITISGSSVVYIQEMEARSCSRCVRIDTIRLESTSVFLLNRGTFQGSAGFGFSGSSDGTVNWLGIMGNTFDTSSAVSSGTGGQSTFSGNYMSVFGNYYASSWSQSGSTAYDMCNSLQGNLVSGLVSGASSTSCTPGTLCGSIAPVQCYTRFGNRLCTNQKPYCNCAAGGYTEFCIPFIAPKIPTACISTDSMTVSESMMLTIEETSSITQYTVLPTWSATLTQQMSVSVSNTPTPTGPTPSDEPTRSFSSSSELSKSTSMSALSDTHHPSFSLEVTPTKVTLSLTEDASRTTTSSPTATWSVTDDRSSSPTMTPTPTQLLTPSHTDSTTSTLTETPSHTRSETLTDSWCEWFVLGVTPIPPLRRVNATNDTLELEYLEFRDLGASFIFDDLGQWWIKNYSWMGDPSRNVTLFTFDNLSVIIPKVTEDDWHATNPIRVGVNAHGFEPGQFYNSELERTVTIGFTFRCAVVNETWYWFVVVNPHHAFLSAAATQIALRSAMLASVLLATPYGSSIAALGLNLQQLFLCQPLTETDQYDVTGLELGDDERRIMRGAIVGNVIVVVGQFVLMMLVMPSALWWNRRIGDITMQQDFRRIIRVMQLPTSLHITVSAVLQLVVAASVSLFQMSDTPADIVLGVFGMLVCALYTVLICYRAARIYIERRGAFNMQSLSLPIRVLPREEDQFLYGEYDKPWYAGFETVFLLLIGVISGSPPAQPYDCTAQYLAVAFISAVSAVVLLYYRPMRTVQGQFAAIFIRAFTIVMCGCAHVMTRSRENQINSLDGAAVCLLLIVILALGRALYDLRRAYYGIPWLVRAIYRLKLPEPIPTPDTIPELELFPMDAEPICISSSSSDSDFAPKENLQETDVIGFLGQAKEEVEEVDDLLRAYRKKKKNQVNGKVAVDLEKVLRGDMSDDGTGSTPTTSSDDEDDDVRRVVKKAPMAMRDDVSSTDSDEERRRTFVYNPFEHLADSAAAAPQDGPLTAVPGHKQQGHSDLRTVSDESLQFTNSAEGGEQFFEEDL